jgi:hypothetical protein
MGFNLLRERSRSRAWGTRDSHNAGPNTNRRSAAVEGQPGDHVRRRSRRHVWVGFQPGGVARYAAHRFAFFTIKDGLPLGGINDLHLDQAGRLWVATSRGGVSRIDDPDSDRPAFANYSTEQGLSSNVATAITDDLFDRIYVGTGQGVDQITAATGQIKHFTTADGLASGEILSAVRDRTGRLWFAARQGLSHLLPEREHPSEPPPVLINGLLVAEARQPVSAVGEVDISLPDLSPGENQLQIDFVGLSFVPSESLRYQYRLMFKETINNLVRHSKCTLASIDLRIEGTYLVLTVTDNGKGFDPDQINEGNGLSSLHRRARSLGGETVVLSRENEGTTVMINVLYNNQSRLRRSNGKV